MWILTSQLARKLARVGRPLPLCCVELCTVALRTRPVRKASSTGLVHTTSAAYTPRTPPTLSSCQAGLLPSRIC